jgi:hypothetical protein
LADHSSKIFLPSEQSPSATRNTQNIIEAPAAVA